MASLGILELLALRGFDRKSRFRMVRHQRPDIQQLVRDGWLETYQSLQGKPVFDGCDFIVSFIADGGTRARFEGVFRVGGRRASSAVKRPVDCPLDDWDTAKFFYELTRVPMFDEFRGRVVIDWGKGTIKWVQSGREKSVYEITAPGRTLATFKDYLDFNLSFEELRMLNLHPNANAEWRARLAAVAGVYLIVATTTGQQYVGSASGAAGIWGRWSNYAVDGHAGNALLRELIEANPAYPKAFSYSLLQIVPRSYTRAEVLKLERRYKEKLGRRATDLNGN